MKATTISSTKLKRDTAEILNSVVYGNTEAIVERYGKPVAKLVPIKSKKGTNKRDWGKVIEKYYGAIPNFPDVTKDRLSRKKDISW
ncbi:MAG: type II toxin-antitoxin system prevent-host-death family antitoxin [Candidatus Woesebacteria bacterium]|jgi:prevent-host-death family protein